MAAEKIIEEWKDINGYEGLYQVSNLGRVKALSKIVRKLNPKGKFTEFHLKEKILKNILNVNGYYYVYLYGNDKKERFYVHRLVAMAFIPNPKSTVNHKDGNKLNNCIDNLEWTTYGENNKHAYDIGLKHSIWKGRTGKNNPNSKKIKCIETNQTFSSAREVCKLLGVTDSALSVAISRKHKCGGLTWEHVK